jgi:hypothetical protein
MNPKTFKSKENKVLLSGSIDADVHAALQEHCRRHPQVSRSAVVSRALRQFLLPDYQEERQRVLAANLDRLLWHQRNTADRLERELRIVREMLALLVRSYYIHTPEVPEQERQGAVISGEKRFSRFLAKVAAQVGPGKSALEQMPQEIEPGSMDGTSPEMQEAVNAQHT